MLFLWEKEGKKYIRELRHSVNMGWRSSAILQNQGKKVIFIKKGIKNPPSVSRRRLDECRHQKIICCKG